MDNGQETDIGQKIKTPPSAKITPQSVSKKAEKKLAIVPLGGTTDSFQYLFRISVPLCPSL